MAAMLVDFGIIFVTTVLIVVSRWRDWLVWCIVLRFWVCSLVHLIQTMWLNLLDQDGLHKAERLYVLIILCLG